jgi:hypothetical protein
MVLLPTFGLFVSDCLVNSIVKRLSAQALDSVIVVMVATGTTIILTCVVIHEFHNYMDMTTKTYLRTLVTHKDTGRMWLLGM